MKNFQITLLKIFKNSKAFTLFEMAIAITITAVLVSIALPSYRKTMARFEANEGRHILLSMLSAQKRFKLENGDYADDARDLDIDIPVNLKYFVNPFGYDSGACLDTGTPSTMYAWISDIADFVFDDSIAYAASMGPASPWAGMTEPPPGPSMPPSVAHIYRIDEDYTLWITEAGEFICTDDAAGECAMAGF